jgi:hypothetical protein
MNLKRTLSLGFVIIALMFSHAAIAQTTEGNETAGNEFTDAELQEFMNLQNSMQKINQDGQQVMIKAIRDNNLTIQRYQEIAKAKKGGEEPEMTEEEATAFTACDKVVQEEQQNMRAKMDQAIANSSMSKQRYIQISRAASQDQSLQQRMKALQQ